MVANQLVYSSDCKKPAPSIFKLGLQTPRKNEGSFRQLTPTYPVGTIAGNFFLVRFGFGVIENGKVHVPNKQRERILNLDESAVTMDGSCQTQGGRPTVTYFYGSLPAVGSVTSKTSQSTTLITGSTSAREILPLHFQFATNAKLEDCEQI